MDNQKKKWWESKFIDFSKDYQFEDESINEKTNALNEAMNQYQWDKRDKQNQINVPYNQGAYGGYAPNVSRNPNYPETPKDLRTILFYGFNGMLAHKWSLVSMSRDEIMARMEFCHNKVPYRIMYMEEFTAIVRQFPDEFHEITFDDAMNIIRIGIDVNKQEEFEDADVDEFDDNCVEACKPGQHACGK